MKGLLVFLSGVCVGAVAGAFGMKYYLDHKEETEYDFDEEDQNEEEEDEFDDPTKSLNAWQEERPIRKPAPVDYSSLDDHPHDSDEDEETEKIYNEANKLTKEYYEHRDNPPRVITFEEAEDLPISVSQTNLLYYKDEALLVEEETQEPIENTEVFIGEALDQNDFITNDDKMILVLNPMLNTLYEIKKVYGGFEY